MVRNLQNDSRKEWMLNIFAQAAQTIKRNKEYKVWQDGNHPIHLDNNNMLDERLNYLHQNPVSSGFVINDVDYYYSSAGDYSGIKGLLDLVMIE